MLSETLGNVCKMDALLIGCCVREDKASAWAATEEAVKGLLPSCKSSLVCHGQFDQYRRCFSSFLKSVIECNTHANLGSFRWDPAETKTFGKNPHCVLL